MAQYLAGASVVEPQVKGERTCGQVDVGLGLCTLGTCELQGHIVVNLRAVELAGHHKVFGPDKARCLDVLVEGD